jgi:hypothetical protein
MLTLWDATLPSGDLSRRFISSRVAACRKSNSPSLRCLRALGRSFGKICRGGAVSVVASVAPGFGGVGGESRTVAVGNRSGAVRSVGSPSIPVIMPLTTWGDNQHRAPCAHPSAFRRRRAFSAPHARSFYRSMQRDRPTRRNASAPSSHGFRSVPIRSRRTNRARGTPPQHILQIMHSLADVFANIGDSQPGRQLRSLLASAFWDGGFWLAYR